MLLSTLRAILILSYLVGGSACMKYMMYCFFQDEDPNDDFKE